MMMWRDKKSLGVEFVQATVAQEEVTLLFNFHFFISPHPGVGRNYPH